MTTPPDRSRQVERQRRLAAGGRPCDKHGLRSCRLDFACMTRTSPPCICQPGRSGARRRSTVAGAPAPCCPRRAARYGSIAASPPISPFAEVEAAEPTSTAARMPASAAALGGRPLDVVVQPVAAPAQEAVPGRHGLHHDRPGMHRRTGRPRRPEGACLRRSPSAPCAARSPSSRRCASASRC